MAFSVCTYQTICDRCRKDAQIVEMHERSRTDPSNMIRLCDKCLTFVASKLDAAQ